ncbi:MAG: polysaccharide biosynthesis protein [Sulfolobales archaeon]|nr:polysaccharide biosynthesis protein [Sulfolobales archaeon]MCX8198641.1 polysaccharide biosynthesis protein [Sulfolobales archaeon]MDW8169715.1 glycosyltransferase [Desulfurococcaceae archaeon]
MNGARESKALIIAGYGGHSGYAFAIIHELLQLGFKKSLVLVAEGYGFLVEKFKPYGEVVVQALPRRPGEPLYRGVHRWFKAFNQSLKLLMKHKVTAVFASGSNFSLPPSIASRIVSRAKLYTVEAIERFTKPSKAVKILGKIGATVFLHWEEQLEMYPKGVVVGPVYEPPLYEPRDEGYALVTTGTLGYKELFDAVERLGLERVVLQTGDVNPEPYINRNPRWIAFKYTSDIHRWIAGASLVITQQGLTAAISRLAYGKPTIIVWNPRVSLGAVKNDVRIYAEKLEAPFIDEVELHALKKAMDSVKSARKAFSNGSRKIAETMLKQITNAWFSPK